MEIFLKFMLITFTLALLSALIFSLKRTPKTCSVSPHTVGKKRHTTRGKKECQTYKELYYKLHNLERHMEVLPEARSLLLSLLSGALQSESPAKNTILSIRCFSAADLNIFICRELDAVRKEWHQYLSRRKQGGPRELFQNAADAHRWLVQNAPLKLVDGAWLGHVHKIKTPFVYRQITKAAWQVLSEELGDGDLAKCHSHVYAKLLQRINASTPAPDTEEFIQHPGMDDIIIWRSALAQLLISLFPEDFLPEILGFNLSFEMLTLETLLAAKELREVGIDPYYFTLHITIDNADTGHTAMATRIVIDYLHLTAARYGDAATQDVWRRIQAGFILSKTIHQAPNTGLTTRIIDIFLAKSIASQGIHEQCPVTFGGRTVSTWLDSALFRSRERQMDFLQCLSDATPWVRKGNSSASRLVHQMSWGGCMFGAFTDSEVAVIRDWIDSLTLPGPQLYEQLIGRNDSAGYLSDGSGSCYETSPLHLETFIPIGEQYGPSHAALEPLVVDLSRVEIYKLIPLWLAHPCLLESFVTVPWNVTNDTGCAIVRLLRAQYGLLPEPHGVNGMDELRRDDQVDLIDIGMDLISRAEPGCCFPVHLDDVLSTWPSPFAEMMLAAAIRPREFQWMLLGMTQAFTKLHHIVASSSTLLAEPKRVALDSIMRREQENLSFCTERLCKGGLEESDFFKGYSLALREIRACFER